MGSFHSAETAIISLPKDKISRLRKDLARLKEEFSVLDSGTD